jgi:hypothetical protein
MYIITYHKSQLLRLRQIVLLINRSDYYSPGLPGTEGKSWMNHAILGMPWTQQLVDYGKEANNDRHIAEDISCLSNRGNMKRQTRLNFAGRMVLVTVI